MLEYFNYFLIIQEISRYFGFVLYGTKAKEDMPLYLKTLSQITFSEPSSLNLNRADREMYDPMTRLSIFKTKNQIEWRDCLQIEYVLS